MEEDDEDRGFITAKDFMNDFGTDEFKAKNVRVRPQSGITHGDQDETKTQGGEGLSRIGEGGQDEEDKFNMQTQIELEEFRRNAKERMQEFMRRRALEEELVKKKKSGYWEWEWRRRGVLYNQIKLC